MDRNLLFQQAVRETSVAAQDFSAIVYCARTEAIAERLVEKLGEVSIEAVVIPQSVGAMEPGDAGYAVCVRDVDEPAAEKAARSFVEDYLNGRLAEDGEAAWDKHSTESLRHWPVCPDCEAPRITRCNVCGRIGVDFPPNDPDFDWGMGQEPVDDADEKPPCTCGSEACAHGDSENEAHLDDTLPCESESDEERIVLRCPSCDEPFVPEFAEACPWCDHRFEDGFELELGEAGVEIHPHRALTALAIILLICFVPVAGVSSGTTAQVAAVVCCVASVLLAVCILFRIFR